MSSEDRGTKGTPGGAHRSGRSVTLKEVAESLGLSPATVSLVLNRSPVADSIPAATHERVRAAARKLGYRPNFLARSLRSQRSFSIGVLVPEISEGYAAGVLSGLENHLMEAGYFYFVASHRSRHERLVEYMELFRERLVEGYVLVNTPLAEPPGLPAVAVAGYEIIEDITNVVIDHRRAAFLALSHLVELGHERIAFFKGHAHSADTEDRWQAIERTTADLDLELRSDLVLQLGGPAVEDEFTPEEGYQEGYAYGRKLLESGAGFTALFAFNDVSAIGAMRAFLDAGLQVPRDVSVVGFDDFQGAAFQNPGLTTIRQPLRRMGKTAGEILLRRLANGGSFEQLVTVEPEFIVRESTAPAPPTPATTRTRGR